MRDFFPEGVEQTAEGAVQTARRLVDLFQQDTQRVQAAGGRNANMLRVLDTLRQRPLCSLRQAAATAGITFPTTSGWELVVHALAQAFGLAVPPSQGRRFASPHHAFLIKRFDRTPAGRRLHFASAMTLTGHDRKGCHCGLDPQSRIPAYREGGVVRRELSRNCARAYRPWSADRRGPARIVVAHRVQPAGLQHR